MLNDLKQPAAHWLADALENLGELLNDGNDPSFILNFNGIDVEIRINKVPGFFEREQIIYDSF